MVETKTSSTIILYFLQWVGYILYATYFLLQKNERQLKNQFCLLYENDVSTREQNEQKFPNWDILNTGGRKYWLDVRGHLGWKARYIKEVDASEVTVRFYQEIYDEMERLVEVHHKYPIDQGHQKVER